jgi:hypothetical protein
MFSKAGRPYPKNAPTISQTQAIEANFNTLSSEADVNVKPLDLSFFGEVL